LSDKVNSILPDADNSIVSDEGTEPVSDAAADDVSDGAQPVWARMRTKPRWTYLPAQRADTAMPDKHWVPDADACFMSGSFGEFWLSDSRTMPDHRV
jgi:hypothetical protein